MTHTATKRPIDELISSIAPLADQLDILAKTASVLQRSGHADITNVALLNEAEDHVTLYRLGIADEVGAEAAPTSPDGQPAGVMDMGTIPLEESVFVELLGSGGVLVWDGEFPWVPDAGPAWQVVRDRIDNLGVQSGAIIPMNASRGPLGTITFLSLSSGTFVEESLPALRRIGQIVGMALEKSRLIADLESSLTQAVATTARLTASNRDLEEFAYIASHDLQEPLRKIRAFGDRLESKAGERLAEQETQYLERVQNAAERMQGLINDLLEFSRVNAVGEPSDLVDLRSVVAGVLSDLEIAINEAGAKVIVDDLGSVVGDATQLRQLFQNLIGNAIKFRSADALPVISINRIAQDDVALTVAIVDNGIGFDNKYLDRIFKPFQRLHGRQEYSGSGIGLAVCRRIAQRHGGNLDATSEVGIGSTFTLTLPIESLPPDGDSQ